MNIISYFPSKAASLGRLPSVIAERYQFHRQDQASGESIADNVAELRKLTTHCYFEETKDFLHESLCDHFVYGLCSKSIQKRLLIEDQKLTFAKAMELAQSFETASKDAVESCRTDSRWKYCCTQGDIPV